MSNNTEVKTVKAWAVIKHGEIDLLSIYHTVAEAPKGDLIEVEIRPVSQPVEDVIRACDDGRDFYENKKLQAECERLRNIITEKESCRVENAMLRSSLEDAHTAIRHYGMHDEDCTHNTESLEQCSCGFSQLLREIQSDASTDKSFMVDCPPLNPFKGQIDREMSSEPSERFPSKDSGSPPPSAPPPLAEEALEWLSHEDGDLIRVSTGWKFVNDNGDIPDCFGKTPLEAIRSAMKSTKAKDAAQS